MTSDFRTAFAVACAAALNAWTRADFETAVADATAFARELDLEFDSEKFKEEMEKRWRRREARVDLTRARREEEEGW